MIVVFRCSKILGEAGKQKILRPMFRKFYSQTVFRTDIFRKLSLGAPVIAFPFSVALALRKATDFVSRNIGLK